MARIAALGLAWPLLLGAGPAGSAPVPAAQPNAARGVAKAARGVALVIGNARYAVGPLRNALNDARDMAATLRELGFEVTLQENADRSAMLAALERFTRQSAASPARVFYYAGHGLQAHGRNYLVPVGAVLTNEQQLRADTIDLDELVAGMGRTRSGINVFIVDACRDNPFAAIVRPLRGAAPGSLASTPAPRGTLLAYSTGPNSVAADAGADSPGANGVYTRHLLRHMRTPGLAIERLFKRVHAAVDLETHTTQQPWFSASLAGEFCFRPGLKGSCRD